MNKTLKLIEILLPISFIIPILVESYMNYFEPSNKSISLYYWILPGIYLFVFLIILFKNIESNLINNIFVLEFILLGSFFIFIGLVQTISGWNILLQQFISIPIGIIMVFGLAIVPTFNLIIALIIAFNKQGSHKIH